VLEEREFRRVGGEEELRVDVRVIAATNRNLREQVELREFRRDLYHRLNVLRIELPPLRERKDDIPRLIGEFIREFSRQHERPFLGIDPSALHILVEYPWPGNVRELRNLIESMVVLAPGQIIRPEDIPAEVRSRGSSFLPVPLRPLIRPRGEETPPGELEFVLRTLFDLKMDMEDLRREFEAYRSRQHDHAEAPLYPPYPVLSGGPVSVGVRGAQLPFDDPEVVLEPPEDTVIFRMGMTMQDLEREAVTLALRKMKGNRRRAAEMLGIGERTLYRKIKEFNLEG
jgi:DNA-binding NtrC family response regulator